MNRLGFLLPSILFLTFYLSPQLTTASLVDDFARNLGGGSAFVPAATRGSEAAGFARVGQKRARSRFEQLSPARQEQLYQDYMRWLAQQRGAQRRAQRGVPHSAASKYPRLTPQQQATGKRKFRARYGLDSTPSRSRTRFGFKRARRLTPEEEADRLQLATYHSSLYKRFSGLKTYKHLDEGTRGQVRARIDIATLDEIQARLGNNQDYTHMIDDFVNDVIELRAGRAPAPPPTSAGRTVPPALRASSSATRRAQPAAPSAPRLRYFIPTSSGSQRAATPPAQPVVARAQVAQPLVLPPPPAVRPAPSSHLLGRRVMAPAPRRTAANDTRSALEHFQQVLEQQRPTLIADLSPLQRVKFNEAIAKLTKKPKQIRDLYSSTVGADTILANIKAELLREKHLKSYKAYLQHYIHSNSRKLGGSLNRAESRQLSQLLTNTEEEVLQALFEQNGVLNLANIKLEAETFSKLAKQQAALAPVPRSAGARTTAPRPVLRSSGSVEPPPPRAAVLPDFMYDDIILRRDTLQGVLENPSQWALYGIRQKHLVEAIQQYDAFIMNPRGPIPYSALPRFRTHPKSDRSGRSILMIKLEGG